MNPESNTVARSELRSFSDRPVLHYLLAVGMTSIASEFFFAVRTFGCLYSGNDYDCKYDPDSPAMAGRDSYVPNVPSILRSTVLISIHTGLFRILFLLFMCAPVYALAYYVGRRYAVHRNAAGIAFWLGAWTVAFLSFPILGGVRDLFNPLHTSWAADLFASYIFAMHGLFCGIAYCALAFRHREKTLES